MHDASFLDFVTYRFLRRCYISQARDCSFSSQACLEAKFLHSPLFIVRSSM